MKRPKSKLERLLDSKVFDSPHKHKIISWAKLFIETGVPPVTALVQAADFYEYVWGEDLNGGKGQFRPITAKNPDTSYREG